MNREIGLTEARALYRCDIPKIKMRATVPRPSWERFSAAIVELKNSARLLRGRVLLGAAVVAGKKRLG